VVSAAAASDAELIAFYSYLYYPTVMGVPAVPGRAVMHPAAHDEAPLRLPLFRDVFASVRGFAFHTGAERRLVERLFPVAHRPQLVMGLGAEAGEGSPDSARATLGLGDERYLLCLGRVDDGKGAGLLARLFDAFKRRRPGPLMLVYAGPVIHPPPPHPDIVVAGRVDDRTKWSALRGATALVSLSWMESFSLVRLEAWSVRTPVIGNAGCQPIREHVRRSGGGFWFHDYATFEVATEHLARDASVNAHLASAGAAYVERNFGWPVLIDRYRRFLEALAASRLPE
jgi:glycosyltransferase involved in cell wall biosynthesis